MIIPPRFPPRLPTDLEIFEAIYKLYYDDFEASKEKPYVRLDRDEVAEELNANATLVSGRIVYRLGEEHYHIISVSDRLLVMEIDQIKDDGETKLRGRDFKINFTYMTSVLADLKEKEERFWTGVKISLVALIFSIASLLVPLFFSHQA